jgi:hypothetical protein
MEGNRAMENVNLAKRCKKRAFSRSSVSLSLALDPLAECLKKNKTMTIAKGLAH